MQPLDSRRDMGGDQAGVFAERAVSDGSRLPGGAHVGDWRQVHVQACGTQLPSRGAIKSLRRRRIAAARLRHRRESGKSGPELLYAPSLMVRADEQRHVREGTLSLQLSREGVKLAWTFVVIPDKITPPIRNVPRYSTVSLDGRSPSNAIINS